MGIIYQAIKTPVGVLYLVEESKKLRGVIFAKNWQRYKKSLQFTEAVPLKGESPLLRRAGKQLNEYFEGKRKNFTIPIKLSGTDFQLKTWSSLSKIPFGKTRSYKQQAVSIRSPNAVRAVGSADGKNPVAIIVPCHRVIGSNGSLTGYAGGIRSKSFLLAHENKIKTLKK